MWLNGEDGLVRVRGKRRLSEHLLGQERHGLQMRYAPRLVRRVLRSVRVHRNARPCLRDLPLRRCGRQQACERVDRRLIGGLRNQARARQLDRMGDVSLRFRQRRRAQQVPRARVAAGGARSLVDQQRDPFAGERRSGKQTVDRLGGARVGSVRGTRVAERGDGCADVSA